MGVVSGRTIATSRRLGYLKALAKFVVGIDELCCFHGLSRVVAYRQAQASQGSNLEGERYFSFAACVSAISREIAINDAVSRAALFSVSRTADPSK
jgi:hypothetical protein